MEIYLTSEFGTKEKEAERNCYQPLNNLLCVSSTTEH